ncbi:MAG: hypothetical protein MUF18_18995 [Fimbriiglobus sp.]|jgi:hypothetical protein|nr:hypothetical protein [Fimbriiglobus sp.]
MPDPLADEIETLHTACGFRRLNPVWAKAEIVLGLIGVGCGLLLEFRAAQTSDLNLPLVAAGLALFVFGGYLTLAGHRSHLYQSHNRLAAYLAGQSRHTPSSRP